MFKRELRKESFFDDLESVLEDIRLLLKDYNFDVDECLDDEDECKTEDEDIYEVISFYIQMTKLVDSNK